MAKGKRRRRGLLASLHLKNPKRREGEWSERQRFWRQYLKGKTPRERRRLIAARKRIEAGRRKILGEIEDAVAGLRKKYPYFKGILIYGSLGKGSSKPRDIDYIKIFDFSGKLAQEQVRGVSEMTSLYGEVEEALSKAVGLKPEPHKRFVSVTAIPAMATTLREIKEEIETQDTPEQRKRQDYDAFELHSWNFVGDAKTRERIARALRENP